MNASRLSAGIAVISAADLAARTTLRLPGRARWLAEIDDPAALPELLAQPRWRGVPRLVLGGGSNMVVTGDVDGLVLHPRFAGRRLIVDGSDALLEADAGHDWSALVEWSVGRGWSGLENLGLIPGQCGAAPLQNIGAYGVELAERLAWVEWLDLQRGTVHRFSAERCAFGYRDSWFKQQPPGTLLVLRIALRLQREAPLRIDYPGLAAQLEAAGVRRPDVRSVHAAVCALRRRKLPDPACLPNAGSFFKNPLVDAVRAAALRARHPGMPCWAQADGRCKLSAAWLVEAAGFKGVRRGAVGVAADHALVLVHHGGGQGAQLLALAAEIVSAVQQGFAVNLEREPVCMPSG